MTRSPHDQSVTLELISRQQEQALAEVAALRDEVRVQSALANRLDAMVGHDCHARADPRDGGAASEVADRLSRLDRDRRGWR